MPEVRSQELFRGLPAGEDGPEALETCRLSRADLERFRTGLSARDGVAVGAAADNAWFRDQAAPCVAGAGRFACVSYRKIN